MIPDTADIKKQGRLALHRATAVPAVYQDAVTPPTRTTIRWHNRLARAGDLDGGFDVEVLEGIDRLVFNKTVISEATSMVTGEPTPLVLRRNGLVVVPKYEAAWYLDVRSPGDGPESVYWMVSRARNSSPDLIDGPDPDADYVYRHTQSQASAVWFVYHGLGYQPEISVLVGGVETPGEIFTIDDNSFTVAFNRAEAGEVRCV